MNVVSNEKVSCECGLKWIWFQMKVVSNECDLKWTGLIWTGCKVISTSCCTYQLSMFLKILAGRQLCDCRPWLRHWTCPNMVGMWTRWIKERSSCGQKRRRKQVDLGSDLTTLPAAVQKTHSYHSKLTLYNNSTLYIRLFLAHALAIYFTEDGNSEEHVF